MFPMFKKPILPGKLVSRIWGFRPKIVDRFLFGGRYWQEFKASAGQYSNTYESDRYLESLLGIDTQEVPVLPKFAEFIYERLVKAGKEKAVDFKTNFAKWVDEVVAAKGFPMLITKYMDRRFPEGMVLGRAYAGGPSMWFKDVPEEDIKLIEDKGSAATEELYRRYKGVALPPVFAPPPPVVPPAVPLPAVASTSEVSYSPEMIGVYDINHSLEAMKKAKIDEWRKKGYHERLISMATELAIDWTYSLASRFAPPDRPDIKAEMVRHMFPTGLEVADRWITRMGEIVSKEELEDILSKYSSSLTQKQQSKKEDESVPYGISPMFDHWAEAMIEGATEEEKKEFLKSDVAKRYAKKLGII